MDRRSFLKHSSLLVSGLAVVSPAPSLLFGRPARIKAADDFSLSLITGNPDRAVGAIEDFLRRTELLRETISFSEHPVPGRHVSDIVVQYRNQLVDFHKQKDELAQKIKALSERLELRREVDNPVLLRFYMPQVTARPGIVNILRSNVLVEELPLNEDRAAYEVAGKRGGVTLVIRNRSVRIAGASCKHKTCVKLGSINLPGQSLVCIPNEIRVTIEGKGAGGVDGIAF